MAVSSKQDILNRLRRIEGQVRGIQRMIDEEQKCAEVLDQVAAVRIALYNAGILILESHTRECLTTAMAEGQGEAALEDLVRVIKKFAG